MFAFGTYVMRNSIRAALPVFGLLSSVCNYDRQWRKGHDLLHFHPHATLHLLYWSIAMSPMHERLCYWDLPHYVHRLPHWVYTSELGISSKLGLSSKMSLYLRIGYMLSTHWVYTQCEGINPFLRIYLHVAPAASASNRMTCSLSSNQNQSKHSNSTLYIPMLT